MAKVAEKFVARADQNGPGAVFYDRPLPYGEWLCRVNAYRIHPTILTGEIKLKQDAWADPLLVERMYGIWTRPTAGRPKDGAREAACARYRDFTHLFSEEGLLVAERSAYLLDTLLTDARLERPRFKSDCLARDGLNLLPCDPIALLRSRSLKDLYQAKAISQQDMPGGTRYTDELTLEMPKRSGRHYAMLTITLVSEQTFGKHSVADPALKSAGLMNE